MQTRNLQIKEKSFFFMISNVQRETIDEDGKCGWRTEQMMEIKKKINKFEKDNIKK